MRFVVKKEIFEELPSACFGVVMAKGIDGFTDFNRERVLAAQDELQMRIARIWGCKTIVGLVDSENPYMELL